MQDPEPSHSPARNRVAPPHSIAFLYKVPYTHTQLCLWKNTLTYMRRRCWWSHEIAPRPRRRAFVCLYIYICIYACRRCNNYTERLEPPCVSQRKAASDHIALVLLLAPYIFIHVIYKEIFPHHLCIPIIRYSTRWRAAEEDSVRTLGVAAEEYVIVLYIHTEGIKG